MSGIFISYRREDSAPYAGRLYDRLSKQFGADQVFMDVDDISPGADFAAQIEAKVASCDAMIAVIGKEWLTARGTTGQPRLSEPNDFVRLEVSLALQRSVLVIPVLVAGASMPKAEELDADLKALAGRNALALSDQEFQRDADHLIETLHKIPALRKRNTDFSDDPKIALRKKLLRRLLWKAPLIFILVFFAAWWQTRNERSTEPQTASPKTALFKGSWQGEVTYSWGDKYKEQFFFEPEGNKLFGTASFLGAKRGIEDGRIDGETISFSVVFEEIYGSTTRMDRNRYQGKLEGDKLRLRIMDEAGGAPVEAVLMRGN